MLQIIQKSIKISKKNHKIKIVKHEVENLYKMHKKIAQLQRSFQYIQKLIFITIH
jgi:hypothetical protein